MRVQRLSEAVANQIAAGEVVERPASVVKELVENALDAEAERVEVEIEGGGVQLIRIVDDGIGMHREDAILALERHATSKIRVADDLTTVATLGFRGEALPSIASVSRFTLTTRPKDAPEATRISVEGGVVREVATAGAAVGTTIEVRDLFFNVPARRKFLKAAQTEVGHVSETIVRLALARPSVAFKLASGGRSLLDVARGTPSDPLGRLGRILGRPMADRLFPVLEVGSGPAISVRGFISAPDLNERTARSLHVFVNGRYVRDRTVHHAIQDAYRNILERGRYPVVVLSVIIDPSLVDVNVHPQKTEVRFADSGMVHRAVTQALERTLEREPWLESSAGTPSAKRYALRGVAEAYGASSASTRSGASLSVDAPVPLRAEGRTVGRREGDDRWVGVREESAVVALPSVSRPMLGERPPRGFAPWETASDVLSGRPSPASVEGRAPSAETRPSARVEAPRREGRFGALEPLGQVMGAYLVCKGPGRMILIDRRAAQARIAFERMRTEARAGAVAEQPLLLPQSLELDPARTAIAIGAAHRLRTIGLELEHFGGHTFVVKSRPEAIGNVSLERLVDALLDALGNMSDTTPVDEALETLLVCAASHTFVKDSDPLGLAEIKTLLEALDAIDLEAHRPNLGPVFLAWDERELARLFLRT